MVAHIIPDGSIGIVACTYRVEIILFHYPDVLDHILGFDVMASVRVMLMSIGAFDENSLAVYKQIAFF
jgi:hypothetical protein